MKLAALPGGLESTPKRTNSTCGNPACWNNRAYSKRYAHPRVGHRARRRQGNPALSADQGARQAGGPVRRQVPDHRFRPEQLHQLGHLLDLRAHAVQQPVAAAAPERRLAVRRAAEDPVHHPGAGADALAGRDLVPGHGRRDLPEHQPDRAGRPARGGDLRRRSHLPHEHHEHDRVPRAEKRRGHRGRDSGATRSTPPSSA